MHLIQISSDEFIDANKVEIISNCSASYLKLHLGTDIYYVSNQYRDQAIKDILMNCTPTIGRDALQGMVSE